MNLIIVKDYEVYPGLVLKPGQRVNLDDLTTRRAVRDGYAIYADYELQGEKKTTPESVREDSPEEEKGAKKKDNKRKTK